MPPKPVRRMLKERTRRLLRAIAQSRCPEVEAQGWYYAGLLPWGRFVRVMRRARRARIAQRAAWLRLRLQNLRLQDVTQ